MSNNFADDVNIIAVYRHETGALGTDAKGTNNLTAGGTPTADAANYREGSSSVLFDSATDRLSRSDGSLSVGYPLKSGTTNRTFSVLTWLYPTTVPAEGTDRDTFYSKYSSASKRSLQLALNFPTAGTGPHISFYIGYSSGTLVELVQHEGVIQTGRWYHVAITHNAADKAYRIRVWDQTAGALLADDLTGNFTNEIYISDASVCHGDIQYNTAKFYGNLDETVIANRVLIVSEIDLIRQGIYGRYPNTVPAMFFQASGLAEAVQAILPPFAPSVVIEGAPALQERLRWRTQVIRPNGSEQRICQRSIPGQGFRLTYALPTADARARMDALLHQWAKRQWYVPVWPELEWHAPTIAAGATSIAVDTRYADFRDNSRAVLWQDPDHNEVLNVATKTDAGLTLSTGTVLRYEGLKVIAPCRIGWLRGAAERRRHPTGVALLDMDFEIEDVAAVTGYTPALTYDGYEVLTEPARTFPATWDEHHDPDAIALDNQVGKFRLVSPSAFNRTTHSHGWVCETKAAAWTLRQWLHSVYGCQQTFLRPTFLRDFELSRPLGASDTQIYVVNRGVAAHMGLQDLRLYLAVQYDGTLTVRKLTAVTAISAGEERLTVNTALGVAVPTGEQAMLSWVDRCRLAEDEVVLDWWAVGRLVCATQLERVSA